MQALPGRAKGKDAVNRTSFALSQIATSVLWSAPAHFSIEMMGYRWAMAFARAGVKGVLPTHLPRSAAGQE